MDYKLLNNVVDSDYFYGSAAQAKAEEILALIVRRSWCDDEYQVSCLNDRISLDYDEFLALLPR